MASSRLAYLRSRLWPPRWLLEVRHLEEMHALEALRGGQDDVKVALERIEGHVGRIEDRQFELRTRLRRTQALTARAYEATQRWPEQLAAARLTEG